MNFRDVTGQSFTFWYTTWPSTHVNAGQTVEVMPRAVHEAEVKQLREELDQHVPCAECIDERETAEAKVEQLRESQKRAWAEAHDLRDQACSNGDEIERLRDHINEALGELIHGRPDRTRRALETALSDSPPLPPDS